jgi:predicted GNAT family N-acyltransferase
MTDLQVKNCNPTVKVQKVYSKKEIQQALQIRYQVFVIGQKVPAEEEIDEFEKESSHYLAHIDGVPCGAARWRITKEGVKLERFAVLEKYRGSGVGSALVQDVLNDIQKNPETIDKRLYLHAQLSAMKLYSNFGFNKVGELFQECDIDHYKMEK